MAQQSFGCPQCGQVDMMQKVTAIIATGTSTERYSGSYYGPSYGQSQTELTRKLAAPERPLGRRPLGCMYGGSVVIAITGAFSGIYGLVVLSQGAPWPVGAFFLFAAAVAAFFLVYLPIDLSRERERVGREMPVWQAAMGRWERLFYCHRCDGVFIPGEELVPTTQIRSLLYEER